MLLFTEMIYAATNLATLRLSLEFHATQLRNLLEITTTRIQTLEEKLRREEITSLCPFLIENPLFNPLNVSFVIETKSNLSTVVTALSKIDKTHQQFAFLFKNDVNVNRQMKHETQLFYTCVDRLLHLYESCSALSTFLFFLTAKFPNCQRHNIAFQSISDEETNYILEQLKTWSRTLCFRYADHSLPPYISDSISYLDKDEILMKLVYFADSLMSKDFSFYDLDFSSESVGVDENL